MLSFFAHAYDDPSREFEAREAASESRQAAIASHHAGRAVDAFGFAERIPPDRPRVAMSRTVLDRATRLWIARAKSADRAAKADAMGQFECLPKREIMDLAELLPEVYQQLFGAKTRGTKHNEP